MSTVITMIGTRCPECGRYFDLLDEGDADEWANGHDCEDAETAQ